MASLLAIIIVDIVVAITAAAVDEELMKPPQIDGIMLWGDDE